VIFVGGPDKKPLKIIIIIIFLLLRL
jgi:hypothetical protein